MDNFEIFVPQNPKDKMMKSHGRIILNFWHILPASPFAFAFFAIVVLTGASSSNLVLAAEGHSSPGVMSCDARSTITTDLRKGYSEQPVALGVTNAGTVMELWSSIEGSTWTLVVTLANGKSCVVSAGDGWTPLQKKQPARIRNSFLHISLHQ